VDLSVLYIGKSPCQVNALYPAGNAEHVFSNATLANTPLLHSDSSPLQGHKQHSVLLTKLQASSTDPESCIGSIPGTAIMKTSSLGLSDQGTLSRTCMKTGVRSAGKGPTYFFFDTDRSFARGRSEIIRLNLIWIIPAKGLMRFSASPGFPVWKVRVY
jgi:hypothetical protein